MTRRPTKARAGSPAGSSVDCHFVMPSVETVQKAARAAGDSIYMGSGPGGWAWAGRERCALVLGPSRAGKTSSLVVPNVLAAPGAVVSTSTKPDVMGTTADARGAVGWTMLYDPTGTVAVPPGVERVGWSPVNAARGWDGALVTADAMVRASQPGAAGSSPSEHHWSERAAALLAPLLHAAALGNEPMAAVLHWVDRHDGQPALAVLAERLGDDDPATDVLTGILATDLREQSGIWSTASGALAAYRSAAALASTRPPYVDAGSFCEGPHTLYICAPGSRQQLLAPLVVGLLTEVRDAAYERARNNRSGPPVLLALDEVANVAPIPDLPNIVAEGAGQGLLTLACLQDLSQARRRWGPQADAFVSLFATTLVLPGIADLPSLETLSAIAGDVELPTRSIGVQQGHDGRSYPSSSTSTIFRRRIPVDHVARGVPGMALSLDARNRVGWVTLTPAYATSPWRELTSRARTREAVATALSARATIAERAVPEGRVRDDGVHR